MGCPATLVVHGAALLLTLCSLLAGQGCAYGSHASLLRGQSAHGMHIARVGDEPLQLDLRFTTAVALQDPLVDTSIWLTDMPLGALTAGTVQDGQILHVELLFRPRPGYTPLDPTATNLAIRFIVCSRGEVGVYQGGGFGYPIGTLDDASMSLSIERATLSLGAHTKGFLDLLTPAVLSGTFQGPRNDDVGVTIRNGADALVSTAFGRSMWVDRGNEVKKDNPPDMGGGWLDEFEVVSGLSLGL